MGEFVNRPVPFFAVAVEGNENEPVRYSSKEAALRAAENLATGRATGPFVAKGKRVVVYECKAVYAAVRT